MANDFVQVTTTGNVGGGRLKTLADMGRQLFALLNEIAGMMNHQNDGTTYTTLEAYYGIPSGKGSEVLYQLSLLQTYLTTNQAGGITNMADVWNYLIKQMG